jgi:phosphate/sulfate permease
MDKLRIIAIWLMVPIIGLLISLIAYPYVMKHTDEPHDYQFSRVKADNDVKLYRLHTSPTNIVLRAIHQNLIDTGFYGINGGFFYNGDLLSIAVMNDRPVKGEQNDYGTGWYNANHARGTLVWDQASKQFSIQVVENAGDLKVTDRLHYWAQGGVSMNLVDEGNWQQQMMAEQMPAYDELRLRSAVAYDMDGQVWLIVTPTPCTIEQFRSAINQTVAPGRLIDGIFLDGDGSSQLVSGNANLKGDGREVYQILSIIR